MTFTYARIYSLIDILKTNDLFWFATAGLAPEILDSLSQALDEPIPLAEYDNGVLPSDNKGLNKQLQFRLGVPFVN